MNAQEILNSIRTHKGAMLRYVSESPVESLKSAQGVKVTKRNIGFVTAGTEFANRKEIREAIESGERGEVQPLPWGSWSQYPFVIQHKGNEYIRLYLPSEAQLAHFKLDTQCQFFANGQPITREQAIELCGSKAKPSTSKPDCMTIRTDHIISIG